MHRTRLINGALRDGHHVGGSPKLGGDQALVVAVDVPHHITHRGNNRQDVFLSDEDRPRYLHRLDVRLGPAAGGPIEAEGFGRIINPGDTNPGAPPDKHVWFRHYRPTAACKRTALIDLSSPNARSFQITASGNSLRSSSTVSKSMSRKKSSQPYAVGLCNRPQAVKCISSGRCRRLGR
jgi:hypothetical protein